MNPWDADIDLPVESARQMAEAEFPERVTHTFELLSSGWDNDAYLADGKTIFRFPRRKVAAELITTEIKVLPLLAPHLTLPISVSRYVGSPTTAYPYVWAGYDFMPATTACRMDWTDRERASNAKALGLFVKSLHSISINDATRALVPGDELQRTNMHRRLPKLLERLQKLSVILPMIDIDNVRDIAQDLERSEVGDPRFETVWAHGDLYSRHILADEHKQISGVIDWGDVHLGDPAVDLLIAYTFLPISAHHDFRNAYGPIDDATWRRAKFRAIFHAAAIADYGDGIGDPNMIGAAQFCFESITREA